MRQLARIALIFLPSLALVLPPLGVTESKTLIVVLYLVGTYMFTASIYATASLSKRVRRGLRALFVFLCMALAAFLYAVDSDRSTWVTAGFIVPIFLTIAFEYLVDPVFHELAVTTKGHSRLPRRFVGWFGRVASKEKAEELRNYAHAQYPHLSFTLVSDVRLGHIDKRVSEIQLRCANQKETSLLMRRKHAKDFETQVSAVPIAQMSLARAGLYRLLCVAAIHVSRGYTTEYE